MSAAVDLLEVSEAGVDRLDPAPRRRPDFARERREADGDRDRWRNRAGRAGGGQELSKLPIPPCGRGAGASQPVERDVVDDGLPGEPARGPAVDERAGDLVVAVGVMVEQPGREPDR